MPVALVGVQARGFFYALMEKRRLATCFVYALYTSGITFLKAVESKRLERTEVQRMMYCKFRPNGVNLSLRAV